MLPDNTLSSTSVPSEIIGSRNHSSSGDLLFDYEDGGIYLNDTSEGLSYQMWTGAVFNGTSIKLSSPTTSPTIVVSGAQITEFSFTFDSNMAPIVAYVDDYISKLYWYDSAIEGYVTDTINGVSPKVFLDDKRPSQDSERDIELFYARNHKLYKRTQRDRYTVEYLLGDIESNYIRNVGMGKNLRLQIVIG